MQVLSQHSGIIVARDLSPSQQSCPSPKRFATENRMWYDEDLPPACGLVGHVWRDELQDKGYCGLSVERRGAP